MSHSVSTIYKASGEDASGTTGASAPGGARASGDADGDDGWRSGGLPALRAELDRIDNTIHDLLMRRAGVVEYVARSGKPAAFRPGREASILRRLVGRHQGALPAVSVIRIWRELLAGTTSMQGGFSLAVCDPEHGAPVTQLAREHFGALTPLRSYLSATQALVDLGEGAASVAVLPYPSDGDSWWVSLMHHEPRLYVIGRLPFWKPRPDGVPAAQALVVASTLPDASEEDHSLVGMECDSDISRVRLSAELSAVGLRPEAMVVAKQHGSPVANVLVDVGGYLTDSDARLGRLGPVLRRPLVLGAYAVPIGGAVPTGGTGPITGVGPGTGVGP